MRDWKHFTPEEIASWPPEHKRCRECQEVLPFSAFHKHSEALFGINTECKTCRKPKSKKQWAATSREYRIWSRSKSRAVEKGREFTLGLEDIVIPDVCPVFNHPFVEGDLDWSPSIDRLDSSRGYTPDNICIISNKANRLKNNATVEDLKAILAWMESSKGA